MKTTHQHKIAWLLLLLFAVPAPAENPFGGTGQNPVTPPPLEDFGEEDVLDPSLNPGAKAETPPPVPSATPNAMEPTPPGPKFGTTPTAPTTKKEVRAKEAPKLEDYLELDASIKGLEVKNFDLPDKDMKDVVSLISKWTGKNFILDSKVRGKITIIGPSQVTLQEAYQAFLSALEANGLTTVQSGKFIRIIESGEARRMPVKTYAGEYAPQDDQFITRIVQLKYINADEVQREFRDLTTRNGKLFAYEPTNSLIITDTGSNIQRIREILESLDVKTHETTLHVLRIKNSSARTISDMLGEIYGENQGARPGQPRSFRKSALERTRGGGIITKIIPDEATNSLVVLANSAGFRQLEALVAKLDVKVTDSGRIQVYYCEYAKADDLAQTLASLAQGGSGRRRSTTPAAGAPVGGAPTTTSAGPVSAELDGGVKITSDSGTNSLVITANSADYQTLRKVIKKLDIPRLQVFVETAILEVAVDNNSKVGTNIAVGVPGRAFGGGFVGDLDSLKAALGGLPPSEGALVPGFFGPGFDVSGPYGPGGATQTITVTTLMGMVHLLARDTNTSILSTPQIIAMDNEKAEFQVLDDTPVQGSSTTSTTTGTTSSIERQKTGIVIKLTPHVNAASRTVRLDIEQKVDSVKDSSSVPTALQASNQAFVSRITNTSVVAKDQDFIMLGGLMSDKVSETTTKIPLLGDIPVLGWLFKSKAFKTVKTNLVILLKPKIINTSIASAELIKGKLEKRHEFIQKNMKGDDAHEAEVSTLKSDLDVQEQRGKTDPLFNYRNNSTDSEDIEDSNKPKPDPKALEIMSTKPEEKPQQDSNATAPPSTEPPIPLEEELNLPPGVAP